MPRILVGSSSFIYQPDGDDVKMNPDGSGEARLAFIVPSGFTLDSIPKPKSQHPSYSSLLLYEAEAKRMPGELFEVSCIYRGIIVSNPQIYTQEDFQSTVSAEPIKTHPKFAFPPNEPPVSPAELRTIELSLESKLDYTIDTPGATAAGVLLYKKLLRGIESYLVPRSTFSRSFSARIPPTNYGSLGNVVNPPGAPALPNSQNYLFSGLSWTKTGGVVTIKEEYMASGKTGWDPDLY